MVLLNNTKVTQLLASQVEIFHLSSNTCKQFEMVLPECCDLYLRHPFGFIVAVHFLCLTIAIVLSNRHTLSQSCVTGYIILPFFLLLSIIRGNALYGVTRTLSISA